MSRRALGRARRTWQARPAGAVVHIVTTSARQRRFLEETLHAVRAQTYRDTGVQVVGWGPGEEHRDLASARNGALAGADARYARLVEAGDLLPWHSTALLVRALRSSDAGTAAGRSQHAGGWRDRAFTPAPGVEPGAGDRLIDLAGWRGAGLAFEPGHGLWGDAVLAAADAALGCAGIDAVVHEDLDRQAALPFGHLRRWGRELEPWLAALDAVTDPRPAWAAAVLDTRLPAVLGDVESLTDAQWIAIVALARRLWPFADPETVRAESRVLAWLTAQDDRDAVTRVVLDRWRGVEDLPTVVRDGHVRADLGVAGLPDAAAVLGERETPLVLDVRSRTADQLEVVGFIRQVATDAAPGVTATAAGRTLACTTTATPTATLVAAEAEHAHDHAWLRIQRPRRGPITITLTSHGVTRAGLIAVPRGDAAPAPHPDPRGDDEIGPYAQLQLQRWYAGQHDLQPDLVYLQAYAGQQATDSPLAIHRVLRQQRPDLRIRWLVADPSVPVPEGAEPVLLRSRAWFETLATARWIVTNIEMERWFRRKPGQQVVQTFHGAPGKAMGVGLWQQMGWTPGRIEQALDAGPRNWTTLLSPSPALTPYYREQFRYQGPVLDHGYPRDDVLVSPEAERLRADARVALGIADHQTAVLYAPTWRDTLATNYRRARLHDGFDVVAAAEALGEDVVILLRGHRFHHGVDDAMAIRGGRVLDVTAWPEVNDLILAADVAVLDYSSIRFDLGVAGRPMIFCVPDLADYLGTRGLLYDFAATAPGPLLDTTEQVVEALRDLPGLIARYAGARAAFHATYASLQDGHAAERVVEAVFGPAGGPVTPV